MVASAKDYRPPKRVSDEHFIAICDAVRFPLRYRNEFRTGLNDIVAESARVIAARRSEPTRQTDRKNIRNALLAVQRAQARMGMRYWAGIFLRRSVAMRDLGN